MRNKLSLWIYATLLIAAYFPVISHAQVVTGIHSMEIGTNTLDVDKINIVAGTSGYYITGSCSGADASPEQGITSLNAHEGVLVRNAPTGCQGSPYSIKLSGTNPIIAEIQIGPLANSYRFLSVPLDVDKHLPAEYTFASQNYFTGCANNWLKHLGSGGAYQAIRAPCGLVGSTVGAANITKPTGLSGVWGEVISHNKKFKIRRTILGGNSKTLTFVNHPSTNNIEIGFSTEFDIDPITGDPVFPEVPVNGPHPLALPAGSSYSLTEEILISPFGHEQLIGSYEGEADLFHIVGLPTSDAWRATTSNGPGIMSYGPYVTFSDDEIMVAEFMLRLDNVSSGNDLIATIDVVDSNTGTKLAEQNIHRHDFYAPMVFQKHRLTFDPLPTSNLEFRTIYHGNAQIDLDKVNVYKYINNKSFNLDFNYINIDEDFVIPAPKN